ncbi:MAG: HEAT repeat domain-containing protein, partial [Nitrospirae bacterium]|nr:HEAT repeat domain-containing protein [Nitrospirota bacterium]
MRTIIKIGGEVAAYMVAPLLRENTYLRNTALIILTELGKFAVPLLYPLLKDKDDDVRKFAIDLLAEIKDGVEPSAIIPSLSDPNVNVRAAAARAFGMLRYREAVPELIKALGDEEWVCFSALESLGEIKSEDAVGPISLLLSSSSEVARFSAIETLGKLGSDKAVDALMSFLPKASEAEKNAAVKSLIQIGMPEMADLSPHLIVMLRDGDWEDKEIALKGIAALNCKEAVPVIVDIAGSLDPSLPESDEKIFLLRNAIKAIDAEEELLKLLKSTDIRYRGKSFTIEILGETKSRKAISMLIDYLNDMRRDLRRASTQALGSIGASESIEQLLETSQSDVDAHVRRSAIEALGNIQSKDAYKPLVELLRVEKYSDVIERIVGALIKIDAEAFLSDTSGYSENVREVIAKIVLDVDILLGLADDVS